MKKLYQVILQWVGGMMFLVIMVAMLLQCTSTIIMIKGSDNTDIDSEKKTDLEPEDNKQLNIKGGNVNKDTTNAKKQVQQKD